MNKRILVVTLLIGVVLASCSVYQFRERWTKEQAPETFKARFETTQGNFDIEATRSLSPKAVDRLYQLIRRDYYKNVAIYRVVPNFVAQFGIYNDSLYNEMWAEYKIPDEPVKQSNESMTIAFARGGVDTRSTQLYINLKDNKRLDTLQWSGVTGFPVIAKVVEGEEVVRKFYSGYGEAPGKEQGVIQSKGNAFLKEKYPKLDYIEQAYILN